MDFSGVSDEKLKQIKLATQRTLDGLKPEAEATPAILTMRQMAEDQLAQVKLELVKRGLEMLDIAGG